MINPCKDHEIGNVSANEMKESLQSKFKKDKEWIELDIEDIELIFDSLVKLKIIKRKLVKDHTGTFSDRFELIV